MNTVKKNTGNATVIALVGAALIAVLAAGYFWYNKDGSSEVQTIDAGHGHSHDGEHGHSHD